MFSSRKAVFNIKDVPSTWIFGYYLKLTEKLHGQDIKIKSIFNLNDKTPSMYVFVSTLDKQYRFKCFSTGVGGDAVQLIKVMFGVNHHEACNKIEADYSKFLENNDIEFTPIVPLPKWEVANFQIRSWNTKDVSFWTPYNIGSNLLNKYNVKAIDNYTMRRGTEEFVSKKPKLYGYFTKNDELYKIYQPENPDLKFITLDTYLQGWDQISGKSRLFVCSSLKDIMSLDSLNIDGDYISPNSENAGIESIIEWIKSYEEKYIIFDNDAAGIRSMKKYHSMYNIPYIQLDLSKDISDSIKEHGAKKVKSVLTTLIKL